MNDEEKEYYKSNPTINTAVNVVVYSRYKEEKMKHQDNSDEKIIGIKEAGQILNKSKSKMAYQNEENLIFLRFSKYFIKKYLKKTNM